MALLLDEPEINRIAQEFALAGLDHAVDHRCQAAEAENGAAKSQDGGDEAWEQPGDEPYRPETNHGRNAEVQSLFAMRIHGGAFLAFPEPDDEWNQMRQHGEIRLSGGWHGAGAKGGGSFKLEWKPAGQAVGGRWISGDGIIGGVHS